MNVCGIRHAGVVSSFHLWRSERHRLLRSLAIARAEQRGEGFSVEVLPGIGGGGVDDVY
jgi:hypothetical protein